MSGEKLNEVFVAEWTNPFMGGEISRRYASTEDGARILLREELHGVKHFKPEEVEVKRFVSAEKMLKEVSEIFDYVEEQTVWTTAIWEKKEKIRAFLSNPTPP